MGSHRLVIAVIELFPNIVDMDDVGASSILLLRYSNHTFFFYIFTHIHFSYFFILVVWKRVCAIYRLPNIFTDSLDWNPGKMVACCKQKPHLCPCVPLRDVYLLRHLMHALAYLLSWLFIPSFEGFYSKVSTTKHNVMEIFSFGF